jgi:hypothetical protein
MRQLPSPFELTGPVILLYPLANEKLSSWRRSPPLTAPSSAPAMLPPAATESAPVVANRAPLQSSQSELTHNP